MRETPLHIAARVKDGEKCALMLLKSGAGPNLVTDDGNTPVHVAAKHGNLQTLLLLLQDEGDPQFKNKVSLSAYKSSLYIYFAFRFKQFYFSTAKHHYIWPAKTANQTWCNI